MTESSTSHVEQQIQQRIAAAKAKVQAAKERRTSLAEARKHGLAHRHARKLRNLAEQQQRQDDEVLSRSRNDLSGQDGDGPEDAA